MASTRDIKAGAAYVELFLHDNRFTRGLNLAQKKLKAFGTRLSSLGKRMMLLGTGIVAPLVAAAKSYARMGDELDKLSARVGASVEFLSALGHAAQIGGTDISAMEVGIRRLQRTAYDATRGLSTAKDAFDALGISVVDAQGNLKATEGLFMESVAALSKLENNTQKAALATMIFGRAGTSLLPMLRDGAGGLVDVMEEAERLGIVMSTEDAAAAATFTDQMTRLSSVLKRVVFNIGAALGGILGDVTEKLTEAAQRVARFIRENENLIKIALKVGAGVVAAGAALIAIGTIVGGVGSAFGAVATVIAGFGAVVGMAGSVVAALLSPLGALSAAVIAVGAYFAKTSGVAGAAMDWLRNKFGELFETAQKVFQGIKDALAAGDMQLAGKILWTALKVEWAKGVGALQELWVGFKQIFLETWTSAVFGLAKTFTDATAIIQQVWTHLTNELTAKWSWAQQHISKGIGWVIAKVQGLDPQEVLADIERQYGMKDRQREQKTQAKLAEIESQRTGALAALEEEEERRNRERRERYGRQMADQAKELDDLIRQRDDAIRQAAQAAEETRAKQSDKVGPGVPEPQEIPVLAGTAGQGTFSAFAAGRLGKNTLAERTAKASEKSARHLEHLDERGRLKGGIPVIP